MGAALPISVLLCLVRCTLGSVELYDPPLDRESQPAWLAKLKADRAAIKQSINYTGSIYDDPAVNWTRLSYVQPQTHLYDRYLYDPVAHRYTVDRYLDDVERRYGGIDSILLWPTYTNLGIDARNQFDYFRALPGGLQGLKELTHAFKARGVRVIWAYNPWDQATRDEGVSHWTSLVSLLQETDGDGFNGDTMTAMYRQFWQAGLEAGYHIVGEMEGGGYPTPGGRAEDRSWESSEWNPMGWGETFNDGTVDGITYKYHVAPGIDRLKWLDSRHKTLVCDRWAKNRTDPLHYAFLNGAGFVSWENVWGIFMHFTQRDAEALRRVATLFRWLGRETFIQDFLFWEPYTPDLQRPAGMPFAVGGPIASKFVHRSGDTLWLVVNRHISPVSAKLNVSSCQAQLYDLYHGRPLPPANLTEVQLEGHGFGAVLGVCSGRKLPALHPLLHRMQNLTRVPLGELSTHWEPLRQEPVGLQENLPPRMGRQANMAKVPRTRFRFRAAGVEIEGGCEVAQDSWGVCCRQARECPRDKDCGTPCGFKAEDSRGVDVRFPWESGARRFHDHWIEIGPFYVDINLVTKADYARYLKSSGYVPLDSYNFLVGWEQSNDGLRPPSGTGQQPVVWVSLGEARAYCRWAGKRLPHAYEWQLAAQGTDGRLYPWGNMLHPDNITRFPKAGGGRTVPELPKVGTFSPAGDSVYGVADLVGHVWQYTDEFRDDHTRRVLLKGSSLYTPMLSSDFPALPQLGNWYFPKALEVNRHNVMMLMDDSYERAGTVGFRCVADHAEGAPGPHHLWDSTADAPVLLYA